MTELGERLVAAAHAVTGEHPGRRAAHARGVCATGTFTATDAAASVSRAAHFAGEPFRPRSASRTATGIPSAPTPSLMVAASR